MLNSLPISRDLLYQIGYDLHCLYCTLPNSAFASRKDSSSKITTYHLIQARSWSLKLLPFQGGHLFKASSSVSWPKSWQNKYSTLPKFIQVVFLFCRLGLLRKKFGVHLSTPRILDCQVMALFMRNYRAETVLQVWKWGDLLIRKHLRFTLSLWGFLLIVQLFSGASP